MPVRSQSIVRLLRPCSQYGQNLTKYYKIPRAALSYRTQLPLLYPLRHFYSTQRRPISKACPSCVSPVGLGAILCKICGSLCPLPEGVNYLSLFGFQSNPPFDFNLDLARLRMEYLKMMAKVHPDSVISKPEVYLL
jgi:hypothetical protein